MLGEYGQDFISHRHVADLAVLQRREYHDSSADVFELHFNVNGATKEVEATNGQTEQLTLPQATAAPR